METPKSEHIKEPICLKRRGQYSLSKFIRDGRDDIKGQPGFGISQSNQFWVVDKQKRNFVQVGNKEGQNNVNGIKSVDNIISYRKSTRWLRKESKFKWGNPCSVEN